MSDGKSGANNATAPPSAETGEEQATSNVVPSIPQQQFVDHTYHNYAVVKEGELRLLDENASMLADPADPEEAKAREMLKQMACAYGPLKRNAGGVVQPFPGKLAEVLDRPDITEIISWMPHGRAFIVKKPKIFAANILPRFFKQTKYLSFTRQLNLWGFKRISRGIDSGSYYHQLFLRGRPYLAMRMRRQKIKGTGMKLTPSPKSEPDFYNNWPVMPPLDEGRVVPPLPPLPVQHASGSRPPKKRGKKSQQAADAANAANAKAAADDGSQHLCSLPSNQMMDIVSQNMLNALRHGAAASSFAALGPQLGLMMQPYNDLLSHENRMLLQGGQMGMDGQALLPLQAGPGVAMASADGGSGNAASLNSNDPIHDELKAMIQSRQGHAVHEQPIVPDAGVDMAGGKISDLMLMERLRSLDRVQQLRNMQSHLLEGMSADGNAPPLMAASTVGSLFPGSASQASHGSSAERIAGLGGDGRVGANPAAEVDEALREANHLEELALAQRAKARSLALAGALQSRFNGQGPAGEASAQSSIVKDAALKPPPPEAKSQGVLPAPTLAPWSGTGNASQLFGLGFGNK